MPNDVMQTLAERGARYGDFADNAYISRAISDLFASFEGWGKLDHTKREGLTMIAQKIARILNGDPEYRERATQN